jgi:flagella basal body P-ring formation protein FlgA
MKIVMIRALYVAAAIITCPNLLAETIAPPRQNAESIKTAVQDYVRKETLGWTGEVTTTVGRIDPQMALAPCTSLSVNTPVGSKLWGRTTVAVRCLLPTPWTIYVSVTVGLVAPYLVAANSISSGQVIADSDVKLATGDVTTLLRGYLTDPRQASGRTASMQIMVNTPLRPDSLKQVSAVQAGQAVRIRAKGPGFAVTSEGVALTSATMGQAVQARTLSGQTVHGTAAGVGLIEVSY